MESRTGERSIRLLDDDDVDGTGERRRVDLIVENAKVAYELANVVHTVHLTLTYHVSNHVPKCMSPSRYFHRSAFPSGGLRRQEDRKSPRRRSVVYPAVQRSSVERRSTQSRRVELKGRLNHIETCRSSMAFVRVDVARG